jgi:phosphoenolpyruvate carboxykinase (GTP)
MDTIRQGTIFTNVALTPQNTPWWEGMDGPIPERLVDWQGRPWTPTSGEPAAHPNSRFTAPARQCPAISPRWEAPEGVPISAFIFGGRRKRLSPLVYEARDWEHGVYVGASMASETTAAATGKVGVVRRDPMAMRPFCGYNMADYFAHWLSLGRGRTSFPKVFHVNWFRQDSAGKYLWPGYGENLRVLRWIHGRVHGTADAVDTEIGLLPEAGGINEAGLELAPGAMRELFAFDRDAWKEDLADQRTFFESFGARMPEGIWRQHAALAARVGV